MNAPFEQGRIRQLIAPYAPDAYLRAPLGFGDYLSLLWRIDASASAPPRVRYYRACATALACALGIDGEPLARLIDGCEPGTIYAQIPNLPFRFTPRPVDAADRKAAVAQLLMLRTDILRLGTYAETWGGRAPGSGIIDDAARERVFAVLFEALNGQYANFARLLLVTDIVLGDLLVGREMSAEFPVATLIAQYGYPAPHEARAAFYAE